MQKYHIETKRLGLRLLKLDDITDLAPLENDADVKQFFPDGPRDRAKTEDMIKRFMLAYEEKRLPCFCYSILNPVNLLGEQALV